MEERWCDMLNSRWVGRLRLASPGREKNTGISRPDRNELAASHVTAAATGDNRGEGENGGEPVVTWRRSDDRTGLRRSENRRKGDGGLLSLKTGREKRRVGIFLGISEFWSFLIGLRLVRVDLSLVWPKS
ncbi:hypothetical protein JCGZ_23670 [Jatropha curcas]|uniref:Uncharacterized protein n=1 Tax=Jatropha curcas TaxID=180498 RepID=A0A067LE24_JATCU|nr:hypothetical protein JCGZ_23670 [Jatropha curcas]